MKLLGNLKKGLAFVISAPAGTGKTTLVRMLQEEFRCVVESISYTTRKPRKNEVEGRDYFFLSQDEFERRIQSGEFLEWARVFDHYYGTSREFVRQEQEKGHHVVLVIDTQGALQLMGQFPAAYIFVSPPNLDELKQRLTARRTETEEMVAKRLSWAEKEMREAPRYDYHIINDNLQIAYETLRSIVIAEEHRTRALLENK